MSADYVATAERTALAWERTGLGIVSVGALLVHDSRKNGKAVQLLFAIAVMGLGAVVSVLIAPARYRRVMTDLRAGRSPFPGRLVLGVGVGVVLMAMTSGIMLRP